MSRSLRRSLLISIAVIFSFFLTPREAESQIFYNIGGGPGSTNYWDYVDIYNPLTDWYYTTKNQWYVRASDLQYYGMTPGQITSLAFTIQQNTYVFPQRDVFIKIKATTQTTFAPPMTNNMVGATTVYQATGWNVPIISYNANGTYYTFNFQTPFMWDGTSNLIFEFCSSRTGYTYSAPYTLISYSSAYPRLLYHWQDTYGICNTATGYGTYYYRPNMRLGVLSGIEQSFPDEVDPRRILRAGAVYDGSSATNPRPSLSFRQTNGQNITLTYKILGPYPSTNVIYEARKSGNPSILHTASNTSLYTYEFTEAVGPAAGPGGELDLTNIGGGSYRVEATFSIPGYSQNWSKNFIIAFDNDLALSTVRSPLAMPKKYPRGVNTPVSVAIQNVGLNNVTSAFATATIRRKSDQQLVYSDNVLWTGNLATGESATIDFKPFNTLEVTQWDLQVCAELQGAFDQQSSNDCLPRPGETHTFQTLYNQEVGAFSIGRPVGTGTYYAQRPFRPSANIINSGMLDLTDIPVRMEIFKLPARTKVYDELVVFPDVGADPPNNIASSEFPPFTPDVGGQYEACMTVEYPGDPILTNNTVCQTFTVGSNLSGTYTIGTLKAGQARNYNTVQDAVDDLYRKGISAPVNFEFTDATYSVGSISVNAPALDLTTTIIGTSATNIITFKPSLERSLSKGSVVVTLNSGKGVGILLGQALTAANPYAVQLEFSKDPKWSNFSGYITFDGGQQKSLVFQLNATTPHRAPFYLGDGTHDVAIRNSIIRNAPGAVPSYATSLPKIIYGFNLFQYEQDVRQVGSTIYTYSAGCVSRQKIPTGQSGNNAERIDTIIGKDNDIIGNEISGFGYGIATMGIGMAIKGGVNVFMPYYSQGTEIRQNLIYGVRGSGIFVAYEDGAQITGNRIHTVGSVATGGTGVWAAGITAGGVERYHNINLTVSSNEISGVTGDVWSRGIVVEQVENTFPSVGQSGLNVKFPQVAESTTVKNNVVWGIRRASATAGSAGIHMLTQRDAAKTGIAYVTTPTPSHLDYFTQGDRVVNNTVMMQNDNTSGSNLVCGIGIQHGNGTVVKNNAVMMLGGASTSSYGQAALFYQGIQMTDDADPMALLSDRNAYELGAASLARFVEITKTSETVSNGAADEFLTLAQWRAWTQRDVNSVSGDLSSMHQFTGIAPNQNLRVKTNPLPIGSVLNNRGETIAGVTTDIDGKARGASGQLIDIGANEFDGRVYIKDYEAITILDPAAYRSSTGAASDAEYIMTSAPVNVIGLVRNSGGLAQSNIDVTVRVYRETTSSNNAGLSTPQFETAPVVAKTVKVSIDAGAESAVNFALTNLTPQTYTQAVSYIVPQRFSAMQQNVTMRYRIEVTTAYDENNTNNSTSKIVRFFLVRSVPRILVSGVNATIAPASGTATQTAGRLNFDSLTVGLRRLGLDNTSGTLYYDVLDREAFEQRAVNYELYRTLFWSGNQDALTRFERRDLRQYLSSGSQIEKKNLAVGSQEYPRRHIGKDVINDESFVNTVLRVQNQAPGTPVPTTANYSGKRVRGNAIARNSLETVTATTTAGDAVPNPALVKPYSDPTTPGLALPAYIYVLGDRESVDSVGGAASASLLHNTVYIGVDWRHWKNLGVKTGTDRVLRGIIDFFESNGGSVVPVELMRFDARARGNNVDVSWTTASENGVDHFEVERADVITGNNSFFSTLGTVTAQGTTTQTTDYGFKDAGVAAGRYLYRLTTVDADGSRDATGAIEVDVVGADASFSIERVTPQPASTEATLVVQVPKASQVRIEIVNTLGELAAVAFDGMLAVGLQPVKVDVGSLPAGAYTLVLTSADGTVTKQIAVRR
ncbi:MAG: T9SS type A sorting domain-containing protein [Ignavibacteria bacterium]|nr:T9SS type A sorting domain-containing protein [Ignavibacteria bacterium]